MLKRKETIEHDDLTTGIVIGTLVGIATGFLLAPRTGKEARGVVRDKSKIIGDSIQSTCKKLKD